MMNLWIIIAVLNFCVGIYAMFLFLKANKEVKEYLGKDAVKGINGKVVKECGVFRVVKNLVVLFIVSFCPIINLAIISVCTDKEFIDYAKNDIEKKYLL